MSRKRKIVGVGGKLKDARERRGISLRQIADSTKISIGVLQALERNDISQLPGGVVGRGFVRSFATAVHLDPEAVVAEFVEQFPNGSLKDGYPAAERPDGKDVPETRVSETPIRIHRWQPSPLVRIGAIAALPVALVVYVGAKTPLPEWADQAKAAMVLASRATESLRGAAPPHNPAQVHVPDPPAAQPAGVAVPEAVDLPDKPGKTDKTATAPATPRPAPAPQAIAAPPSPPAVAPAPTATSAAAVVEPTPAPVQPVVENAPAAVTAPAPAETPVDAATAKLRDASPPAVDRLTVVLSVRSPSWVIAVLDGKRIVNRLFEAGEQETIDARGDLVLTAGDAGAIAMTLNGVLAKRLGNSGETVRVIVNRTNFKSYLRSDDPSRDSP